MRSGRHKTGRSQAKQVPRGAGPLLQAATSAALVDSQDRALQIARTEADENAFHAASCHRLRCGRNRECLFGFVPAAEFSPNVAHRRGGSAVYCQRDTKGIEVTVAEDETGIVAFLARRGEEVRLLYTRPDRIGMGAGSQLIEESKATGVGALELWCFQANERARRFYEARGFHPSRRVRPDSCAYR
jgi:GNAT superfamily N-acetyltransferase